MSLVKIVNHVSSEASRVDKIEVPDAFRFSSDGCPH